MPSYIEKTRRLIRCWNRHARHHDRMSEPMEHLLGFGATRARLFTSWRGDILELGVGTGKNVAHYPVPAAVIAMEISQDIPTQTVRKAQARRRFDACRQAVVEAGRLSELLWKTTVQDSGHR